MSNEGAQPIRLTWQVEIRIPLFMEAFALP